MKITKTLLKQIIKEELEGLDEDRPMGPIGGEREKHEVNEKVRTKAQTLQRTLEYLARKFDPIEDKIYDLNRRVAELEKG